MTPLHLSKLWSTKHWRLRKGDVRLLDLNPWPSESLHNPCSSTSPVPGQPSLIRLCCLFSTQWDYFATGSVTIFLINRRESLETEHCWTGPENGRKNPGLMIMRWGVSGPPHSRYLLLQARVRATSSAPAAGCWAAAGCRTSAWSRSRRSRSCRTPAGTRCAPSRIHWNTRNGDNHGVVILH